jgi:hypothetical protein
MDKITYDHEGKVLKVKEIASLLEANQLPN